MKMGTSVDGFIVPDVMGTTVLAVIAYGVMRLVLQTHRKVQPASGYAGASG
jgi:hypothetical protein